MVAPRIAKDFGLQNELALVLKVHFLRAVTAECSSLETYLHGGVPGKPIEFGDSDTPFLEPPRHLLFEKTGLKS